MSSISSRLAFRNQNATGEEKVRSKSVIDHSSGKSAASGGSRFSPSPIMSVPVGSAGKLVQEIHDEFLVCKICMEPFKTPKCLACLHTFCEVCIENHIASEAAYKKYSDYREFTCPLCRKRTQLPLGGAKKLPDNFLISNLSDTMDRQKVSGTANCDICKTVAKKLKDAASKCLDCNKLLCSSCVEQHKETKVTRDHSIFDVETEKDVICKEHEDEVVRFYCEPCQACICIICTFNEHKDHEVSNFSEAVVKYKADIEGILVDCKSKIEVYEKYVERVAGTERQITEAEQKIRELAIEFISDIRQREKQLIDEIHNLYGKQTMEVIGRKADLQSALSTLKSTCALTEMVLQGKDIELLLLKKEVQEKLSSLSSAMDLDLPKTMSKEIRFLPGHIELGSIQDMDKPNASKFRSCIVSNSSYSSLTSSMDTVGGNEDTESVEVQTEPVDFLRESCMMVDFTPTRDVGQFGSAISAVAAAAAASAASSAEMVSAETQTVAKELRDQESATVPVEREDRGVNTSRMASRAAQQQQQQQQQPQQAVPQSPQQQQQQPQQVNLEDADQQQQQQQQSGFFNRRRHHRRMMGAASLDEFGGGGGGGGGYPGVTDL
ncbi:hypothetical protein BOX15_Mlig033102g1 [Macrostomum lignano]|uniref:RING-type domain-containing protein n=1 Tax=Macrostomum lignano TaxID=282301 RepID=A0A267GZE4_9PLAT|nr:hypothetical protein BOX15_Mlig033102g2 [Macrostomum lignano]PAA90687.1 hypothetical protein BOX15_Mlig033102g1 [Macrostomum lignano]